MKNKHRIISFLLAAVLLLTSFGAVGSFGITADAEAENLVVRDDALHFIVRHWHTGFDKDAKHQTADAQLDESGDWFVVVEGYILPNENPDPSNNFDIYLVNKDSGELVRVSGLVGDEQTPYLGKFNKATGTLELMVKPLRDNTDGTDLEKFCGISLSAGRGAVNYNKNGSGKTTSMTIQYSEYTHLVKAHVFYSSWNKTVPGSSDPALFDPTDPNFKEIDTAEVYTYKSDGSIVKNGEDACWNGEDLEEAGVDKNDVELTKFYSTNEGMHTNKTLVQLDGRTFLSDLEAWYIEGNAANIGFVLDASGSMAFTSDNPTVVNVYEALAKRLDFKHNKETGLYTYKDYPGVSSDELKEFICRLAYDEGMLDDFLATISDKLGYEFAEDNWNTLFGKIGILDTLDKELVYTYPQHDKMIGYYEMQDNKGSDTYANYRTWFLNSIKDADSNGNIYRNPASYSYDSAVEADFSKMITYNETDSSFDFSQQETLMDYGAYGGWGSVPINFGNSSDAHRSYGMNLRQASAGFMPSQLPESNKFTVSFTLENTYDTTASFNNMVEILYVGNMSGDKNAGGYLRVTREGGNIKIYNGHNDVLYTLSNVFGSSAGNSATGRQRFTFVFNGESVGIYSGLTLKATVNVDGLGGNTIVFAPFLDVHESSNDKNTGPLFYLDDIFVYDTNLSTNEVKQLCTVYNTSFKNGKASNIDDNEFDIDWNSVFLEEDVLALLLNPRNTAHTPLGVAAYNYFVYDAYFSTKEYSPLAYTNGTTKNFDGYTAAMAGKSVLGRLEQVTVGEAGWYYLTHGSDKAVINALKTAKRLIGLGSYAVQDYADLPGIELGKSDDGTGKEYQPKGSTCIPFYIDKNGNLRCFFSRSISNDKFHNVACSYVYELQDSEYVKTEALQRVLANFSSKLSERSPASKISAVKFSAEWTDKEDLKELMLLDWTDDQEEIASIMSQKRGSEEDNTAGTAGGWDMSQYGNKQYNYVLTGGTYLYTGLQAYKDLLATNKNILNEDSPKFIVVFTDGVDNSLGTAQEQTTKKLAKELKDDGYTIITVYLPCGPAVGDDGKVDTTNTEYQTAKEFLTQLGGNSEESGEEYFFASNDLETLQKLFEKKILEQIVDKIEGYTVKDYIDPRFDMLNEDGSLWQLKTGGQVVKTDTNGESQKIDVVKGDPETGKPYVFHLAGETTPAARDPYLHYDADKDMYYLEWLDQTIPSTPVGSDSLLPVWNAEVILKAKDDFIGGNTVLTTGNEEEMNWLFHPADVSKDAYNEYYDGWDEEEKGRIKKSSYDAASGTNDMYKKYEQKTTSSGQLINNYDKPIDEFPSKGFPRVTANVELLSIDTNDVGGVIYMGEAISPRQLLTQVEDKYMTESYYLDYIKRYAYQRYIRANSEETRKEMDMPLFDLLAKWLEIDNDKVYEKEFSVPYIYLPNVEYDDQTGKIVPNSSIEITNTGTKINKQDVLGVLTYRWEQLDPAPEDTYEPIEDFVKSDTKRVMYSLTVEYTPFQMGDTLDILNSAVGKTTEITANNIALTSVEGIDGLGTISNRATNGEIFAKYVPIDPADDPVEGCKMEFTESFGFDREKYVNNVLINETQPIDPDDSDSAKVPVYLWNSIYKPASLKKLQPGYPEGTPEGEFPADGTASDYGDATFLNKGRTLTAFSKSTLDVVSGGIALELKMLIGELREVYDQMEEEGNFQFTFTLDATRSFTDTEIVERIKQQKIDAGKTWKDYDDKFKINFDLDFDFTQDDFDKFEAEAAADPDGYVRIYAMSTDIQAKFGGETKHFTELPIGTYDISLADINEALVKVLDDNIHFATIKDAQDEEFKAEYLDEDVLYGLNTKDNDKDEKGNPNWSEQRDKDGNIITKKDENDEEVPKYNNGYEITDGKEGNIDDYKAIADTSTDTKTVTFYIGTMTPDTNSKNPSYEYVPKRGNVGENLYDLSRYTYDRLGMLVLSTGNTLMTIKEIGGKSHESFVYHITGKTLGDKDLDLIVTVYGTNPKGTTIELPPGNYEVTEISDWSWKYDNEDTYGEAGEDWVISSNLKQADATLRYKDDDPEFGISQHKTVTYVHGRNDKVWLGSEDHLNNHFVFEQADSEND